MGGTTAGPSKPEIERGAERLERAIEEVERLSPECAEGARWNWGGAGLLGTAPSEDEGGERTGEGVPPGRGE